MGFGNGAKMVLDGSPLATVSAPATSTMAVLPVTAGVPGVHTLQVWNNGTLSNSVYSSAAIHSVDGSGARQGYIFNSDGTLNSPSNPAATGSAFSITATSADQ